MKDIGIFNWFGYIIPMQQRIDLMKQAGFKTAMLSWDETVIPDDEKIHTYPDMFRKNGLFIENIHVPYDGINNIWLDNIDGDCAFNMLSSCITDCNTHSIPVAVVHVTSGYNPPPISNIGMDRIKKLVELAEDLNVKIALENLKRVDYIEYIFSNISSRNLGFCYDSGHDFITSDEPYKIIDKYKDKLIAVHLHDNNRACDDHLTIGEGKINWTIVKIKLNLYYNGSLTLECLSPVGNSMTPLQYLQSAFDRANKYFDLY